MRKMFDFREGWLILGLVIALAASPATAMRWADWVPGLWVLQAISVLSVIAGFFLAKSRFSKRLVLGFGIVYGLFVIGFFSGVLLPDSYSWNQKIPEMITRQAKWLAKAANIVLDPEAADTSRDGLIFVMQTGALLWVMGFASAWYTFRNLRIWRAILPNAIVLLITISNYYGPEPMGFMQVVFMFTVLLYIVGTHYMVREHQWVKSHVIFNRETRLDFFQVGFVVALLAIPLAWMVPNVSAGEVLQDITAPLDGSWQRVQDGWTQLFASLKSYGGEYSDYYGGTLALGGPRHIQPVPVMDIRANSARYWRGTIYDRYTGDGWTGTADARLLRDPLEPINLPLYGRRVTITATVTSYLPNSGMIYFPHQPVGTDRQSRFTIFEASQDTYDVINAYSRYVIYEGKSYKSWGTLSVATAETLRLTSTDYPDWVVDRYLQLPPDTSSRVIELANSIAAPHETQYDIVDAMTNWLRTNITYNEGIQAPPEDVDPLEHFLFETKEGYCNYYASALAVMLRSQGIPARVAAGFTRGTYIEELDLYRVYSDNAHTWVEVFFPDYGWLEFEPTASQSAINRTPIDPAGTYQPPLPEGMLDDFDEEIDPDLDDELLRSRDEAMGDMEQDDGGMPIGLILVIVVGVSALIGIASLIISNRARTSGLSATAAVYDRMSGFARWLGVQLRPSHTPHERAAVLMTAAPDAAAPIDVITDLYVEECFGQVESGQFDARANDAWRELWPKLLNKSFLRQLSRLQRNGRIRRRPKIGETK